ncbi:hypothetical protein PYCCODRAFT_629081 [Trametes coccinea BRFM310]|uniref:Uncharacterized protein n=1 Tax=Trametes coccinea (strain BRFM310) TaxID=1353009 RepID=A0A1Y2J5W0_TRAC3|nr:hypothetical protein PYCCODRAFT_629081 [Trametes coccinea BRFM310]
MNTVGFGDDRRAVANFSAVSSGVGLKSTSTGRTASNAMGPPPKPGPWKNNPTPIQTPASIAAVLNPFSKGRISSTLDDGRNRGSGPSGNRTAAQTIFNDRPVRSTAHYHVPASQPAKRQKTTHGEDSKYFRGGGGAGTGSLNGKGKAAVAAFEPVVIPDSDEERGARLSKGKRKESTPDPLDCIDVPEPSTSKRKSATAPIHDFERTSDDEQLGRLPPDGPSTIRLQQQQQSRGEIVDIDLVSDDEIESASGFDQDDGLVRKVATPNGRQHIPQGAVRQKITMYELKDAPPPPPPPKPAKQAQPPTIDLLKQQTRKGQMKPRNPKQPTTTPILALENRPAHAEKADVVAIAPSGFKPASRGNKPETPQPLPLEGVSLGCHIMQGEIVPPTLWASVHHNRGYKLLISTARKSGKTIADFALPKDVHSLKYTDTGPSARSGEVVVVQLSSTNTAKFKHKAFEPGSKYAAGLITLKFITNHTDWDGSAYKELIAILRSSIPKAEVLRGAAAESCWETAEIAAKHKAGEFERNAPRQTRSNASSASSSSASAGPSHDTSTSVPSKEIESVSAPPGRTNATERRLTRQTARAARNSTTPENMDELVLVYPPSGTGAVNITKGDLRRLDNGQYLNDTLIEFGLKCVQCPLTRTLSLIDTVDCG